MPENTVTFDDCEVVRETAKAILVIVPDLEIGEPVWIPQSQVHENSECYKLGTSGDLVVTRWLAQQKGWI